MEKLHTVPDPEMGVSVADLGLIYKVTLRDGEEGKQDVHILMTLTSPGCPLADMFDDLVGGAVRKLDGVGKVRVEITFDPPWNMSMLSEYARAELGYF